MTPPTKEMSVELIRKAVKGLGADGAEFGFAALFTMLGAENTREKDVIRTRVGEMFKRGELQRVKNGVYTYNEEYRLVRDSPLRERVWRFIRTAKPGWTCKDASLKTGVSLTHVLRFCDWLEQEGFIQAVGRQGTARTFRATQKALQSPEMPQPPSQEPNPFEKECRAAGKIVNLLLYHNPYSPKVAKELARCGEVILARFGSQNEKSNQVEKKEQAT